MTVASSIRVLIVEHYVLVRAGLRTLLETQPDIKVIGEMADGIAALEFCRKQQVPDVILKGLVMPGEGALHAIEDLHSEFPSAKVLLVTTVDEHAYARMAKLAGAAGCVTKMSTPALLLEAIRAVHAGKTFFPNGVLSPMENAGTTRIAPLSLREREIVALIALGFTSAEIANKLHISEKTVEKHRTHISEKLGITMRAELVRFALAEGLLKA